MFSPVKITSAIKGKVLYEKLHNYFSENNIIENQESSANIKIPFDVTEITTDNINMKGIERIKNIINISTQNRDIYEVQLGCNKAIALNILKYLSENILREEPDFLLIKFNNTIPDYGSYGECDIPIRLKDPPKSFVLNIYDDMIYQIYMKKMYKMKYYFAYMPVPDCKKSVDILDQADALGIISNLPIPDPKMTSQSAGISPLSNLMETFILSLSAIQMEGIKSTTTQQLRSILRCAKYSEDLSLYFSPLGFF
ncbi:unnamed protein product [Rhizophagus irregularis]|nr:unnamed protein product [Rhizophagus irregularis]